MSELGDLRIAPANLALPEDLRAVFGTRGDAARCQCQRFRLGPGEAVGKQPVEERMHRPQQAGWGNPDASTSGLVAWLDDDPVGWCAVSDLAASWSGSSGCSQCRGRTGWRIVQIRLSGR